jgi:hypothetical protein
VPSRAITEFTLAHMQVALRLLCWVKRALLSFNRRYQFLYAIEGGLIRDPTRQAFVMLYLAVEFDALFAHFRSHIALGSAIYSF